VTGPRVCGACRRGWHPECVGTDCYCPCNADTDEEADKREAELESGENPDYGPGNPDWEYDAARDDQAADRYERWLDAR
jgi:hypothetical protein